ncbi:hypothetical protein Tco_0870575 [Tanacetum coccineum]
MRKTSKTGHVGLADGSLRVSYLSMDILIYSTSREKSMMGTLMVNFEDQKELNMRQRRWLELLNDYYCEIRYHPGKANIVAGALSRKERIRPHRVLALVMTIGLNPPKQIRSAQSEAKRSGELHNET